MEYILILPVPLIILYMIFISYELRVAITLLFGFSVLVLLFCGFTWSVFKFAGIWGGDMKSMMIVRKVDLIDDTN